jgi:hypothetical protein
MRGLGFLALLTLVSCKEEAPQASSADATSPIVVYYTIPG